MQDNCTYWKKECILLTARATDGWQASIIMVNHYQSGGQFLSAAWLALTIDSRNSGLIISWISVLILKSAAYFNFDPRFKSRFKFRPWFLWWLGWVAYFFLYFCPLCEQVNVGFNCDKHNFCRVPFLTFQMIITMYDKTICCKKYLKRTEQVNGLTG